MISSRYNTGSRLYRECGGNTAVEFALILPVLLLLIIGIFEFGRLYWIQNTLQYAAEQTSRCIMAKTDGTNVTSISGAGATCPLSTNLGGLSSASVTITNNSVVQPCTGGLSASRCQILTITYLFEFDPLLAGIMGVIGHASTTLPSITLTGQSQVPIG